MKGAYSIKDIVRLITVIVLLMYASLLLIGCEVVVSRVSDSIDDLIEDSSGPTAGPLDSSGLDYVTIGSRFP